MEVTRKQFVLGGAAIALAARSSVSGVSAATSRSQHVIAAASPPKPHGILRPADYDRARMFATLETKVPNRQVFQVSSDSSGGVFGRMTTSLNAFEISYGEGYGRGSLATLAVLMGGVLFGLNDAMWEKYEIDKFLKSGTSGATISKTNPYYHARSSLDIGADPDDPKSIYHDTSVQAVAKRGGAFMMCNNALSGMAYGFANQLKLSHDDLLAEWKANVWPEFTIVPAGVAAVALAEIKGWSVFTIA